MPEGQLYDGAVHVGHGVEHAAGHIFHDLRARPPRDRRRDGAVFGRTRLGAEALCHVVLHHDDERAHLFALLHEPHHQRRGDVIGQVRNDGVGRKLPFQRREVDFEEVFEGDLCVGAVGERFGEHGFELFVDLEGENFLGARGKLARERARPASDLQNRRVLVDARKLHDGAQKVRVRNKVLPELFFEGKAVLSQNQTQIFHKMTE